MGLLGAASFQCVQPGPATRSVRRRSDFRSCRRLVSSRLRRLPLHLPRRGGSSFGHLAVVGFPLSGGAHLPPWWLGKEIGYQPLRSDCLLRRPWWRIPRPPFCLPRRPSVVTPSSFMSNGSVLGSVDPGVATESLSPRRRNFCLPRRRPWCVTPSSGSRHQSVDPGILHIVHLFVYRVEPWWLICRIELHVQRS